MSLSPIIATFICLLTLTQASSPLKAQSSRLTKQQYNSWFMLFGDPQFSEKWGLHYEIQWRRNGFIQHPQQLLLRTGINYHLNKQVFFTVGYCFVDTHPYGSLPVKSRFPEHRFWEQVQIKTNLSATEWISRYRLEQRFSQLPVKDSVTGQFEPGESIYTHRFRVLNRFSRPIGKSEMGNRTWYASVYDEFFLNFGKNVAMNLFDQNRLYLAMGYKISSLGRFEAGYMLQTLIKPDGRSVEQNHTLQIGLTTSMNLRKWSK